jgi:hypothetical protein
MNNIIIKQLNDKYYKNYKYLFIYTFLKFNYINKNILFNFIWQIINNKYILCNYNFDIYNIKKYENILFKNYEKKKLILKDNYNYNIINALNTNKCLFIFNTFIILLSHEYLKNNNNNDVIYFYNGDYTNEDIKENLYKLYNYSNINKFYSSIDPIIYKQFLINLKNNKEENNVSIPKIKYELVSCHIGYISGLSLSASYNMTLQIPHMISTIAMSLKSIEKNGTLLLFWSIVNVNIPIIKKLLSLLSYGFKNIEIIDNDINQNLLIGVPEYYIKCSGYKNNVSNDLINELLDIAIHTFEKTYLICDILDYYQDYTDKNPNHSLFYNKTENIKSRHKNKSKYRKYTKTKKYSHKSFYKSSRNKSYTRTSSIRKSKKSQNTIKPIYYIEDINISELDEIMKDSTLQFKVSLLMNKLEGIFVGYFEMVNNLIVNAIATDKKGQMYVKPNAILQKDITNLTRLITMFEYNKLPYNKHALKVLLGKQDELVNHFYAIDKPINNKLIQYNDRKSKILNKSSISHFRLSQSSIAYKKNSNDNNNGNSNSNSNSNSDIINDYYNRIKLAYQVKEKLLDDSGFKQTPQQILKVAYDFDSGLIQYINKTTKNINTINNDFLKLWEILDTFQLIPHNISSFKILHLAEITGQNIVCAKYWIEHKCSKLINNNNYEWMANTINPYNKNNKKVFGIEYNDNNNLIKDNYNKWLFGNDNSGNLTNIQNIKTIMNEIKNTKNNTHKVNLIISDNYNSNMYSDNGRDNSNTLDTYTSQKIDLSHVISVIACSTSGGSCCVKHFIPYVKIDKSSSIENTIDLNNFFIGYLYLYYTLFDSISLYKPNTSNADNGEFYVIGKGFKGVNDEQLESLFKLLDKFVINTTIIEPEYIPETFINQIMVFLEDMSNFNILNLEKQNLLLTCYKNFEEEDIIDRKKFQQTNKILKCNNLFNRNKIETMLIPKYKEWMKIYEFLSF